MAANSRQADQLLIAALARGLSIAAAARQSGLSERTAHRRLSEPSFRAAVATARSEMLEAVGGSLVTGAVSAARVLRRLLRSTDDRVALGAAKCLIEASLRVRDAAELERRLQEVENGIAKKPACN